MQIVVDVFTQIFGTLWAHKLRSFLTMFGIAWGVGSLLLLVGLGEGFRTGNQRGLSQYGENIMMVFPGRAPAVAGSMNSARNYRLTYQDYQDIRSESPHIKAITPVLATNNVHAVSEFASASGELVGAEPQYSGIRFLPLKLGRWLNDLDEQQKRSVVVLGDEMTRNLFPGRPAVGSFILLNGHRFEVIGSLQRVGRGDDNSTNMRCYIPFQLMRSYFPLPGDESFDAISSMNYQPLTADDHKVAEMEVRRVIGRNHGLDPQDDDAFEGWDTVEQAKEMGAIFDAMNEFLGTVGLVTLALGAIGVINIMLIAVTERTREIGLRKALGATNRSIMMQFFAEGILVTLVSGLIGMAFAGGLMTLFSNYHNSGGFDPPRLVAKTAILAIASLMIAGVAAGLYPACKAASLEPVEALRQE
jgi:putative ABC transport system permease protein